MQFDRDQITTAPANQIGTAPHGASPQNTSRSITKRVKTRDAGGRPCQGHRPCAEPFFLLAVSMGTPARTCSRCAVVHGVVADLPQGCNPDAGADPEQTDQHDGEPVRLVGLFGQRRGAGRSA